MSKTARYGLPSPAPVRRTRLTGLILEQLRSYALAHGFQVDDRLPPERELAARLNVSRPSLRNALDWLSQRGAVRRVQGGGTFLNANFLAVLAEHQEHGGAAQAGLAELIEARAALEPVVLRHAVERATPEQLAQLAAEVARAVDHIDDEEQWCQHELRFHVMLARLSANSILTALLETLLSEMVVYWRQHFAELDRRQMHDDHRTIAEALARRDLDGAVKTTVDHLQVMPRLTQDNRLRASA